MNNPEAILAAQNLRLQLKRKVVFSDLSIAFKPGEAVLIAGKSGAGKSSLLKCLAGVYRPDSGTIHRAPGLTTQKIGLLSDQSSLFEDLTIQEGVRFHCSAFGIPTYNDALIRLPGLDVRRPIKELSAGERVLFHLSLLIAQKPEILLIDEVIHTIDPYLRDIVLDTVIEQIDERNVTIITVNQTFSEVEQLPERIVVLENGIIHLDIPREELLSNMRKAIVSHPTPPDLPVIFQKRSGIYNEIYIYPFNGASSIPPDFHPREIGLGEALKAIIGGLYVQKRV